MQGPVDETDCDYQTNTVSSRVNKGVSRHTNSQKSDVRADSGTCNVCSAPCSSCLHINQSLMGSKHGESLDGTFRENAFSCSVNDAVPTVMSGKCEIGQHTASETSNVISVNSSHDSFSENAESKASLRISDVSGASQDVEISQKLSGGSVRESLHTSKPHKRDSDKSNLINKFEDLRGLEGHDDNISCLSGANEATKLSSSDSGTIETKTLATSSAFPNSLVSEKYGKAVQSQTDSCLEKTVVEGSQNKSIMQRCNEEHIQKVRPPISLSANFSSHNSGLMENPLFKDIGDGTGSESVQSESSNPPNGKSISCNPSLKNLEVDSCSQLGGETPECSREYLNPSMAKEVVSKIFCGQKPASYTSGDIQDSKIGFVGGNSDSSTQDCPKLEAETKNITINLPAEALNSVEQMQKLEKVRELLVLPDAKETSMQSHPVNESDESDIVEDDVKVCDICGDAGREDLLVVCCRCSDGAEHIYCTKGMLDKIPEGDWVCKDCELEERNNQAKDKLGSADGNDPDVQGNKTDKDCSSVKISRKRNADDAEVSSVAKRQALEPTIGSPKTSSPIKVGVLSRDSSFKNLDKGKVKPAHQFPHGIHAVNDTPETASPTLGTRQQTPRGAFLKSNSFSTANAKPKGKLVDEVVLQKQKSIREPATLDTKEGASRVMGKSLSFKSVHSGRLSSGESKVKMLSPKFPHVPDLKGLKHTKDRIFVERKNSFKSERPLVSSTIASSTISSPRVDKKLAARGDTVSFSSISNNRELKAVPSDSKLTQSSRPVNQITHKGSEVPVPLGEGKRQLSLSASGVGNYAEQKPIHDKMKDNSSSNFLTADRPICKISDSVPDGLPQSRESTNVAENVKESSNSRPRQSITAGGKSVPCQKCKDIGHSAEFCIVDSPQQPLAPDIPTSRSSKEAMDKGNRLKAAIEAAMLKKPGIYRKNRVPDQSDEVSVSSINCEVSSQDQLSNSSNPRKLVSGEEVNELESAWNSIADSKKQITGTNVKQFTLSAEEVTSRSGNGRPILPADGKPFTMDVPSQASVATSAHLMMSAIPEHEYIWQGCFEVHRSGSLPDLYDGFQAHLSTYASRRVLETMNKFPSKVLLNEVPRLSTWPIQFEETGAKDDHIALYFFARDHDSYEKSYKIVLEGMMRNDLALKGNIDGVEILIFPSNRLPVKSQRWNTMFFLWGVFRGKRVNCLQQVPGSPKKFSSPQDFPTAIMSLSENICSPVPIDSAEPKCNRACNVASDAHASIDLPWSSTETINGDSDTKVVSLPQNGKCAKLTVERPENRLDCNLLPNFQTSSQHSRSTTSSLEGHVDSDCKVKIEPEALQVTRSASGSNISDEKIPTHSDTKFDRRAAPQYFSTFLDGRQEFASLKSVAEENIPDMVGNDKDQLKLRNLKVEGLSEAEAAPEIETTRVPSPKDLNACPLNHRKRSFFDSPSSDPEAVFAGSSQTVLWNGTNSMLVDGGSASKKGKLDYSDLYGFTDRTSSSRDGSRIQDVASSSAIKKNRYDEGCEETAVGKTLGNAERYFFPVDPFPVTHVDLDNSPMPRKGVFLENEEPLQERVPNLELALGAEMKPPMKQSLPPFLVAKVQKNVNQDHHPGRAAIKAEEDDVSAALSLSLSFPFPDKDQAVQPVTKTEQLLPERRRLNPSPLFGGFSDK